MYSQSSVEVASAADREQGHCARRRRRLRRSEASKNKAIVLLFVDQSVTNTKLPDPRIDRSRMKMTLEKVDGRCAQSKVELPLTRGLPQEGHTNADGWTRRRGDGRGGFGAHRAGRRGIGCAVVRSDGRSVERSVLPRDGAVEPQRGP